MVGGMTERGQWIAITAGAVMDRCCLGRGAGDGWAHEMVSSPPDGAVAP